MTKLTSERRALIAAMRQALVERFPQCFDPRGLGKAALKKPLKIGILDDIIARCPDLDIGLIKAALRDYATGFRYQSALIEGAPRFDLDGEVCSTVTAEQAKRAFLNCRFYGTKLAATLAVAS